MLVIRNWKLKFKEYMLISVKTSKKMPNNFPKGISVTRLAKLLGVSQCMLSQMANDKIVISQEKYEKIQEKLKNLNLL